MSWRSEELPDDMTVDCGSGTGQSSDSEVCEKNTKSRSLPRLGEFQQKHNSFISDRQCYIETLDTATDKYLRTQE